APKIRGDLRKIGIKEKSVFLDALDVAGYLIKNRFISVDEYGLVLINNLIEGSPDTIFNYLIELLDSDKIDYPEKYGEKAIKKFKESYSKDKANTVKQIIKQILADLPKLSLNGYMSEYAEVKGAFSEETFNLINERLDNYDFKNEDNKRYFLFYVTPKIRGDLRKIGIKEKSVFLDALDVAGYFIKNKFISNLDYLHEYINELIEGSPDTIFNYLTGLDPDEIDYPEKYGEKAIKKFKESYSKDKAGAVKEIIKQILADLPKD
ncbi:exported protein A EppA, partial [Borreliella bavariensis]|uniref:exported protein A EppA n=3 Tax=Borreliella bavariensis TaxID=664662 RepID=UPI001F2FAC06